MDNQIEVIYIAANGQVFQKYLDALPGLTVADALKLSCLFQQYPEARDCKVGVFAKTVGLDSHVKKGDRIEVYRALLDDPMEKRRQRVVKNKS